MIQLDVIERLAQEPCEYQTVGGVCTRPFRHTHRPCRPCIARALIYSQVQTHAHATQERLNHDRAERLERALAFFASAIKSGEPWTESCEREYRHALGEEK